MKKSKKFITAVLTFIFVLTANVFTFAMSDNELAEMFNGLGIKDTGLLVEHIQSITLSDSEKEKLFENLQLIDTKMSEVEDAAEYPRETLLEVANLALESAHILQMDIQFTNRSGEPIGLSDIVSKDGLMLDFLVAITDSEGNFLAEMDPRAIDIPELDSITKETVQVVKDSQENASEEFQPETGGRLPDTAASYGNYIIVGVSLMAFSALGLIAARKKQAA